MGGLSESAAVRLLLFLLPLLAGEATTVRGSSLSTDAISAQQRAEHSCSGG
jgi:hypothetical protein